MKKIILTSFVALSLSACTTMQFTQNGADAQYGSEQMRHHAIIGLVEIQDPVNLKDYCSGKPVAAVQTQTTPINVLINMVSTSFIGGLYSQRSVAVACDK